jgi:hypothetical protein
MAWQKPYTTIELTSEYGESTKGFYSTGAGTTGLASQI